MAKAKSTDNSALYDEARALGIEPSGYGDDTEKLQERVNYVRAEKEAVGGSGQADLQAEADAESDANETQSTSTANSGPMTTTDVKADTNNG